MAESRLNKPNCTEQKANSTKWVAQNKLHSGNYTTRKLHTAKSTLWIVHKKKQIVQSKVHKTECIGEIATVEIATSKLHKAICTKQI